jgi:hypothetical protein
MTNDNRTPDQIEAQRQVDANAGKTKAAPADPNAQKPSEPAKPAETK